MAAALVAAAGAGPTAIALAGSAQRRASSSAATSSSQGLDVLPFPGTPDASPATNIIFPAASGGQIASVTAVGSRSGLHSGHLSAQPAGHGSAFSPTRPFRPGERVTVTAALRSPAAATASGARGSSTLRWSFEIARTASFRPIPAAAGDDLAAPRTGRSSSAHRTHSFVTEPHFHVPWVSMHGKDPDTASGDIFLDAQNSGHPAALFLNPRGELRWFHPSKGIGRGPSIFNTRVQRYRHHRVITYWRGLVVRPGVGHGEGVILNSSYKTIHTVQAGDGYRKHGIDLHEFTLGHEGSEGTAFVEIWSPVHANLTSVGGPPNGIVFDWIIQEIDVATGRVIWEWHALGHVPISDSYQGYSPGQTYDYFHLNSIQQLPDGRILISARHTWAVYSIEKKTGKIAWELGGKHSSFNMGAGTQFFWQHDATLHGHGLLTVFADGGAPQSRALLIHLGNHQATLVHAYTHKPGLVALSQGSTQRLPNRNVFVGWGSRSYFSEYTPRGRQIFSGSMPSPIQSYRAYRSQWVGKPRWPPAIAIRKSSAAGHDRLYMSWNGATRVVKWRIEARAAAQRRFTTLSTVAWRSFETSTRVLATRGPYFRVQGLDARGMVLPHGTSATVHAP
ncbi:MAG: arylsulfotransferase family protein [Solirubrobacteraceae bacterium]